MKFAEERIVGHGVAEGYAVVRVETKLKAPAAHEGGLVGGVENVFAFDWLAGGAGELRCADEIEAVFVEEVSVEIGRHSDETRLAAGTADDAGDGLYVGEFGSCVEGGADELPVEDSPEGIYVLREGEGVDFAGGELAFEEVKLVKGAGHFGDFDGGGGADEEGAVHIEDEEAVGDDGVEGGFKICW